ncbi:MAG: cytochrome c5 family protein [Gammaproteobacteria bacterium]|jgi:cytochrome c5|nr:cytochrome c5 family protein [Gammaproteobacteria bacterium]HJN94133.1 c-type cytochrome [Gammaproteobacteria bacterium]|tara:strand:+ start:6429 stop:6761 length:333 start_codon:yes stop_codon:yes gene_type:complete
MKPTGLIKIAALVSGTFVACLALAAESEEFDAAATYKASCYACHSTSQAHAPMLSDAIEWEIRLEKGMDILVQNTINGLNGVMPARGLCTSCSDDDLQAVVEYMVEQSQY